MPKIPSKIKKPDTCIACSGTGKSTRGEKCWPCRGIGTKQPPRQIGDK